MSDTARVPSILTRLQRTAPAAWIVAPRVIAGGILVAMGALPKLTQAEAQENVTKMLELGGMPAPGAMLYAVAIGELVAGLLILSGLLARVGGVMGAALMLGAVYTHVRVDFSQLPHPDAVPPHFMPFVVLIPAAIVAWFGGGKWSVDRALTAG